MFIIVEGPDGAGKSTLVRDLAHKLWEHNRGTVLINPKRAPRQHQLMEYKTRLDFYRPRSGVDLILDRSWYSEDVYGPIWRGQGLQPGVLAELEAWALRRGAVVALLDAHDEVLEQRVKARGDIDVSPSDVWVYAARYREQAPQWQLPVLVNPDLERLISAAREAEQDAPCK